MAPGNEKRKAKSLSVRRAILDSADCQVLALDRLNPKVAARTLGAFSRWRRYDEARQTLMQAELERILAAPKLSRDAYEIASKSLK